MLGVLTAVALASAGAVPKEVMKESKKELDIATEVVAFYKDLLENSEDVRREQARQIDRLDATQGLQVSASERPPASHLLANAGILQ